MVRGVHKKIIEVADTQNEFFERAILIVKEGFRDEDSGSGCAKKPETMFRTWEMWRWPDEKR